MRAFERRPIIFLACVFVLVSMLNISVRIGRAAAAGWATSDALEGTAMMSGILRAICIGICCVVVAGRRMGIRHPARSLQYARWLRSTPWTANDPLPLGNVQLEVGDWIFLAIATLLTYFTTPASPIMPLLSYGITYNLTAAFLAGTHSATSTIIKACLAGMIRFHANIYILAALVVVGYLAFLVNLKYSLAGFSWTNDRPPVYSSVLTRWPFRQLSPEPGKKPKSRLSRITLALQLGWWTYCIIYAFYQPNDNSRMNMLIAAGVVTFFVAAGRDLNYVSSNPMPYGLGVRLMLGRIIEPKYDRVHVAPLLILAAGTMLLIYHGWILQFIDMPAFLGIFMFTIVALCGCVGPSRRAWLLTGGERLDNPKRRKHARLQEAEG